MKIYIACDHRGVVLKEYLIGNLQNTYEIIPSTLPNSSEDDYPDFAFDICTKMDKNTDLGILICGSGVGMSIIANKVKGIRCARVLNKEEAIETRTHQDANVLALSAKTPNIIGIIDAFLETPFSNEERHIRRIKEIEKYEEKVMK